MIPFILLFVAILLIIFLTSRQNWHPFIVLLMVSIGYGLASGMSTDLILSSIKEGFGGTLGSIGIVIVAGIIIGVFFEQSGGAYVIAQFFEKVFGKKRIHAAIGWMGYLISIPVFADSGFVILTPLNKALTKKVGISLAGTVVALSMGLTAAHTMIPPTPGPLAAAAIIGADLGWVIIIGLFASSVGLLVSLQFAKYIGKKIWIEPDTVVLSAEEKKPKKLPSLFRTLLPIVIPILLIVSKAIVEYPGFPIDEGHLKAAIVFIGHPLVALLIGIFFAVRIPKKRDPIQLSEKGWMGKAISGSATILLITAAGGVFGKVIQASEIHLVFEPLLKTLPLGLALPFLLAALIKTAQGSSTVAIVTAASIVFPILEGLGLTSTIDKALVVAAIGSGSTMVSHANDSFFWVLTQFSNMSVPQGYRLHTLGTLVLGGTSICSLLILKGLLTVFA
jgi:GntP family gluconate:H+ symporter